MLVVAGALLGLIPAAIAQKKGRSFIDWYLFGAALWPVAIPAALMIKPKSDTEVSRRRPDKTNMDRRSRLGKVFLLIGGLAVGVGLGLLSLLYLRDNRSGQASIDLAQAGAYPQLQKQVHQRRILSWKTCLVSGYDLQDLSGKPVVINFWATWCIPCEAEMPLLQESYERYPGLEVLAVNFAEPSLMCKHLWISTT
jgi:thiol:disulfide interchange protein